VGRYDTGVVSGALVLMDDELRLSARQKEWVVSSAVLLAAVGAVAGGVASERWGRKLPINMASALFVVGAVVVGFAPSYHVRPTRKH
jgi:MFS family permease